MPIDVLGVPACGILPEEDAHQAAPLAEPDTELNADSDIDQTGLYELWPPESDGSPHGFGADQLQQLYLQLSHHCQLMIETFALTACNSDHQEAAVTVANLLAEYQVGAHSSLWVGHLGSDMSHLHSLPSERGAFCWAFSDSTLFISSSSDF